MDFTPSFKPAASTARLGTYRQIARSDEHAWARCRWNIELAAGFTDAHAHPTEWVRTMTPSTFEEMAMSSTKMRAAVESTGDSKVRERLAALFLTHDMEETVDVPYRAELLIVAKAKL